MTSEAILEKLREICRALPETEEVETWGHPTFRVRGKIFATFGICDEVPAISFRVEKVNQGVFLSDPRFYETPYVGKHGGVSLIAKGRLNWREISEYIQTSYALIEAKAPGRTKRK